MENTPEIRFKGFSGDWEQHKVGDFTSVLSASRVHKDEWETDGIPFFRSSDVVSAFKGIDNEKAYISKELYEKLIKSSGKLEKDDILITGGGSIGIPYIVPSNAPLYTKDADLIWIKKSSNHNSKYLYTYFTGLKFRDYINSISHVGTIAHYTIEQVKDTPVMMPNMAEQKVIGDFLLHIDHIITLHQRKCDEMSELKKYMLQKMFPKKGEQIPEIRFSGFTKPWERRKVSEITSLYSGGTPQVGNSQYYDGDIPFIRSGEIYADQTELFITQKGMDNSSAKLVSKGDILYALYGATSGEVNRSKISGAINQAILAIIPNEKTNADFLVEWFRKEKENITDKYLQGGQGNLSAQIIKNWEMSVPSFEEQNRIGDYFVGINNLIVHYQCKCAELKQLKKYMFQNMFPKKG